MCVVEAENLSFSRRLVYLTKWSHRFSNVGIYFIKFHAFSTVSPTLHLTESHVRLKCSIKHYFNCFTEMYYTCERNIYSFLCSFYFLSGTFSCLFVWFFFHKHVNKNNMTWIKMFQTLFSTVVHTHTTLILKWHLFFQVFSSCSWKWCDLIEKSCCP